MKSRKRQRTEGIELPNQEKISTLGEKETYKFLEILEANAIKQAAMKEKNYSFWIPKENEKTTLDQTNLQKSHRKINTWACKILGGYVDNGRTSTNGSENKKTNDDS